MRLDLAVVAWIALPIVLVHVVCWRRAELLRFQLLVDVLLLLLPGRLVLQGLHLGPGIPADGAWGGSPTVEGIAEQTDLPLQFEVWWDEVRRLAAMGEPPWISERIGGGAPLYANGQSQIPFPLNAPVWALGARRGSDVMVFWKLELAALGAVLLFRRWRLRPAASCTGALSYGFGLYPLAWSVVPLVWVVAALPWALWALAGSLRGCRRCGALLGVLLGTLGGWSVHPETAGFLWLAVASAGAVLAAGRWRRVWRLAVPFVLALAVAGIGALPTVLTLRDSAKLAEVRSAPAYPLTVVDWGLRARAVAMLVSPWCEGHPADGTWRRPFAASVLLLGVGGAPLVWMLGGRPRRRLGRHRAALMVLAAWAVALVLQPPGIAEALARVPVLGVMTWPRAGLLPGFVLAALGALGCDGLLRRPQRSRLVLATTAILAVAVTLLATARLQVARGRLMPSAVAPAVAGTAALSGQGWLLPLVVAAEAVANDWSILAACPGDKPGPAELLERLVREQSLEGGRVLALDAVLPANRAAAEGLADLSSNDPVRPLALTALHHALGSEGMDLPGPVTRPWAGLAGAWGVRWLITPPGGVVGGAGKGWEEVAAAPAGRIYRNERVLQPLRLVGEVVSSPGDPADGGWEGTDFSAAAVGNDARVLGGRGEIQVIERRPWRWHAVVRAQGPVLAVLHVPRAPGWQALLDGREVRIEKVDLAAMAVELPAGVHSVVWQYRPPGLIPGALLTVLGLAACAGMAMTVRRRRW